MTQARARACLACVLLVLLAACGGGEDPQPDVQVEPPRCERGACQ